MSGKGERERRNAGRSSRGRAQDELDEPQTPALGTDEQRRMLRGGSHENNSIDDIDELGRSNSFNFNELVDEMEPLDQSNSSKFNELVDEMETLDQSNSSKFNELVEEMETLHQPVMHSSGGAGVDWDLLGVATSVFCDAPGVFTMGGPMDMESKRRKLQERRKRQEPSTSVAKVEEDKESSETDSNMSLISKLLSENPDVDLERLVLNRRSFSQTLENILCMSCLVKEGRAEVKKRGVRHFVVPRNVPSHEERGRGQGPVHNMQSVFRFDLKDWRYMKESVQEGTELILESGNADKAASGKEAIKKPLIDGSHHGSQTSGGDSVSLNQGVEPRSPAEKSTAPISTEDALVGQLQDLEIEPRRPGDSSSAPISTEGAAVASTGKKKHKKKLWKKNRKQKANKDASESVVELLSIRVEEPPPAPVSTSTTASTPAPAVPQESHKKLENEDHNTSDNGPKVERDSGVTSAGVDDESGSQEAGKCESVKDILDFEDEQKYEIEIGGPSARPSLEWGLCGEDDRGTPTRTPPPTSPLREPRTKNKGQVEGREQPSSPGPRHMSQSPRDPWRRKLSESWARHEPMRSSSCIVQPPSPSVSTIEPSKLEGLSEWNRIKAIQQHAAAEVASHKNWIPRKGIQRAEGGDNSKGRGKAKQSRGEQNLQQLSSGHHATARQKFDADLKLKQDELLQRSKQSLKAEFQKAKRIETTRKGRDELELELERNLVYRDGELIYLNQ
ncbi:hypothetical protein R1flu_024115 [Riccia fluitans]|uniref:Non-structural maintenance of chromosomes element 4 n=1 Tax=Riccia fluitans TaxID=41844 RepID=A0ABD1XUT8_9MARC